MDYKDTEITRFVYIFNEKIYFTTRRNMKKYFIALAITGFAGITAVAQSDKKVLTTADYEGATKSLGFNTSKLVFRNNVNPNWLPDGKYLTLMQTQPW